MVMSCVGGSIISESVRKDIGTTVIYLGEEALCAITTLGDFFVVTVVEKYSQ